MRGRWARAANSCAPDARLLAGDNLSQEPMEQAGTVAVTSANEPVVVDSAEGSENRARKCRREFSETLSPVENPSPSVGADPLATT